MRKSILRAATALVPMVVAGLATPVMAQAAEESTDDQYGDIVVTAQGRDQLLQEVPVAITVVDSELITNSGVTDVRGLRQLTPSLQSTTGQSSATGVVLSIRGIGTAGDNPGFEPAVGVFVDGVFRARAGLALSEMPELERVEVLRGPQGTLFGRNTSAGALSIVTAGPKFDFGGYIEGSFGNFDEKNVKLGVTGPLNDTLAVRFDGGWRERDGYITEINTGKDINNVDRQFFRGQLLYDNGDNVQFRMIADYARTDEECCGAIHTSAGPLGPLINGLAGAAGNTGIILPANPEDRRVAFTPGRDLTEKVTEWGISGQLDIDLGGVNLTSITAYRDWDAKRAMDIDFSGLDRAYRDGYRTGMKDFTQEIRIQGEAMDGKLDWMVGGFYLNEDLTLTDTIRFGAQADLYTDRAVAGLSASTALPTGFQLFGTMGPTVPLFGQVALATNPALLTAALGNPALFALMNSALPATPAGAGQVADNWNVKTEAYSFFTHNIFNVSESLTFTFGLRWNHEKKDIDSNLNSNVPACAFFSNPATAVYTNALAAAAPSALLLSCNPTVNSEFNGSRAGGRSEDQLTGTAKVSFKLNDNTMLFGSYAKGYKSGGYNLDRGSFDTVRLGGNGAQITDLEFGKETVDSFEIGVKANPTPFMQLNVTGFYQDFDGYQNLRFEGTRFVVRQYDKVVSQGVEVELGLRPIDNLNLSVGYTYLSAKVDDPVNAVDDHDKQLTNQPKHVVTGAVTWTPPISDSMSGLVHIDMRSMSAANTLNDPVGVPFTTNDAYTVFNARLGLNFADGKYGIELYGQNIFDQYYNITSFPVPEQPGAYAVYPGTPRFYGVKLKAKF